MDLKDIQNLIKFVAKSGASEVKLEMEDIKITVKTGSEKTETTIVQQAIPTAQIPVTAQAITPAEVPAAPALAKEEPAPADDESKYLTITSPIIGTFYRKPSPDKPMFVEVGDVVNDDSIVCVIEAMKLFNEIESEVSGKIVKILVEDSSPVEFGQPLFLVDPS
jgi:acetyl-CoA carboxylase biotin carboxyl carrier protein